MKLISISLFALNSSLFAAVPLTWTVETTRVQPATFDVVRGETIALEASFNNAGKPFAMDGYDCALFWQTNGMGSAWWTAPAAAASNRVSATFSPEMDPGAATVNGFLGSSGSIYRAAFTFRFRHGPGAMPNALPLPVPVIDFAKVRVLNPPWGGGVSPPDTNAVIDIIRKTVDGAARPLPKYLWLYEADDSYPAEAEEYYRSRGNGKTEGGCSSVRDGGFLSRNFDYPFDSRAEFVVKMSAGKDRFASVGVAQVGTNLTEAIVTSGKPEYSRFYKWLPGATVDGINANGVACNINVVDGEPQTSGWHTNATSGAIHPLAAIRWILDHATNAQHAATYIAAHIRFPQGWTQNVHFMVADETSTYIVENGTAYLVGAGASRPRVALTNFRLYPTPSDGEGQERYVALTNGANITSQWWTLTYTPTGYRPSDLPGITGEDLTQLFNYWENNPREAHRGETFGGKSWWQSIHTSVYDLTNCTLRICVQEKDDCFTFKVPAAGGVKPEAVREIVEPMIGAAIANKADKSDLNLRLPARQFWEDGPYEIDVFTVFGKFVTIGPDAYIYANDWSQYKSRSGEGLPTYLASGDWNTASDPFVKTSDVYAKADRSELAPIRAAANEANVWSSALYSFMTGGRTNCWFSGTNYVFGTDAAARTSFAWEDGMDAATVPCSMALWEIRDGVKQLVWDQRDWPTWYWSFKSRQMQENVTAQIEALGRAVTNDANYAWAKRYASDGTPNPDSSTTFIDTPSVTLSPGMKWETVATVSGAAYWTIVGNGAVIGGSGTNAVLRIRDFEGNDIMTVTKGEHRLAWLEQGEFTDNMWDENGWVCFDMLADAEPVGYFSTTLDSSDFLPQSDPNCPAQYRWENLHNGKWRIHFLLKPGIQSSACFAKFQVEVEGQTVIRYNAGQEISGGLIYNGVKIAPDVSGSPAVGTVIQWKVVR